MDFFQQSSNFVAGVDFVFYFILGISLFWLLAISTVMVIFIIKYRRKKHPKPEQFKYRTWIEATWIILPTILVLFMFYFGYMVYLPMRTAPKDAMVVKTYGRMWKWSFEYPNGKESDDLYLPFDKPVKLDLISLDVNHGFSVPAFRIKQDVVPGKSNSVWFVPQQLGDYEIFCSSYCGLNHSYMGATIKVISVSDFDKWMQEYHPKTLEPEGLKMIKRYGCTGCHSIDGTKGVGPTFKNLYDAKVVLTTPAGDKEAVADELYIRRSIFQPSAEIVKGYPDGIMKSYRGVVKNDDIKTINEYLKTIK
jgi:cytochrome c oxidase subunit II